MAIDGGLFEHFDAYRGFLSEYMEQMLGPEVSKSSSLHILYFMLIALHTGSR